MTIDSVVQKTGITLGVVVLVAAATWFLTGPVHRSRRRRCTALYLLLDGRRLRRLRAVRW